MVRTGQASGEGQGWRVVVQSSTFFLEVVLGLSHLEPLVDPSTGAFSDAF